MTDLTVDEESPPARDPKVEIEETKDLPWYIPRWNRRPWYDGKPEAFAWSLDVSARGVTFVATGTFLATALLRLAKQAAGCEVDPAPGENEVRDCNERIYGFRPSSLLTIYTFGISVAAALLMPLMGAVVDYTPYRRRLGRILSLAYCFFLFSQIFVFEETWVFVAITQIFVGFIGWCETMLSYAYLPEMGNNSTVLHKYNAGFTTAQFSSMIISLISVICLAMLFSVEDDVAIARLGGGFAFVTVTILMYIAWTLYPDRPSAHELPEGKSICSEGFLQVIRTFRTIHNDHPNVRWLFLAVAFSDAAIISLPTIAITFMTDTLQFSSTENGIAIMILLVAAIPGGFVASFGASRNYRPTHSVIAAGAILAITSAVAGLVLTGPRQLVAGYLVAFAWGIGMGWKWTTDKVLASTLTPRGQEAELMGMYIFASQSLIWLPTLVFTIMNETRANQRFSVGVLAVYYVLAMICYAMIGDNSTSPLEPEMVEPEMADAEMTASQVESQYDKDDLDGTLSVSDAIPLGLDSGDGQKFA